MANWTIKLTIAASTVAEDLTDFPLYVDLTNLPSEFWNNTLNGTDIVAYDSDVNQLAVDLIFFEASPQAGVIFVKVPSITTATDTIIYLTGDGVTPAPSPNDFGKEAVWLDYEIVIIPRLSSEDRTGKYGLGTVTGSVPVGGATGTNSQLSGGGGITTNNSYIDWYGITDVASFNGDFTIACSMNGNRTSLSYRSESAGTTNVRTVFNSGGSLATWSELDSWLTDGSRASDTWYRLQAPYDTTNDVRYLLVNGTRTSDSGSIGDYASTGYDTFTLGREDLSNGERFAGQIGWSYLRGEILSQNWLTAEYNMLVDNSAFLTAETGNLPSPASPIPVSPTSPASPVSPASPAPVSPTSPASPVEPAIETRVTQLPILTVDLSTQPARITQIPILLIAQQQQPSRVTQLPVSAVTQYNPIALPGETLPEIDEEFTSLIIPETPVTEIYEWLTIINASHTGKEQRSALRINPRVTINFNVLLLNDADRQKIVQILYYHLGHEITYPLYHYSTKLLQSADIDDTDLYFDVTRTNMRDGEGIAIFDPNIENTRIVTIDEVTAYGATLVSPLDFAVPARSLVAPAPVWRVSGRAGFTMRAKAGTASLTLETIEGRAFLRPGANATLTTFDSLPVLDNRFLADNDIDENYVQSLEWLDVGTAKQIVAKAWAWPQSSGTRTYKYDRFEDSDYWREFLDECLGRQNSFWLPSFRDDLPLTAIPALGATVIRTNNIQYERYFKQATNKVVYIKTTNGFIIRRVNDIVIQYNSNGDAYAIDLKLATALGNNAGDNIISSVSIMNLVRLNDDRVTLVHEWKDTFITLEYRTVNE